MNELKNLGISIGVALFSILILTFIMTLLNYVDFVSDRLVSIFQIIIPILSLFVGGFLLGKKSLKKGWLQGIKLSVLFLVFLVLFQYLGLDKGFGLKDLVFYLLIMMSSIFGSMIGINRKKETT